MKLLLDEMWSPEIAVQLRARGHDVQAVAERDDLRGLPGALLFAAAQAEQRVIVTENVGDFRRIAGSTIAAGGTHAGLIFTFTTDCRYPRHERRTLGRMVR